MDAALQELLALAFVFAVVAAFAVARFLPRRGRAKPAAGGCHGCGTASGCASRATGHRDKPARLPVLTD